MGLNFMKFYNEYTYDLILGVNYIINKSKKIIRK